MLLIDGVKYEEWVPQGPQAEDEFERVVEKHAEEIFGKDAKYFDLKHRLASRSGTGSIPDGYVITLGDKPGVRIIELELASHSLQHIVSQMVNIINGIENPTTQQKICNAIEDGISEDEIFTAKIAKAIKPIAIHRFLSDSFSNTLPIINIIIDKSSLVLEEAIRKITPPPRIIEFQTFTREGVGLPVHAHLFEPLNKPVVPTEPKPSLLLDGIIAIEIECQPSYIRYEYIGIKKRYRHLFPDFGTTIELTTDDGGVFEAEVSNSSGSMELWYLRDWYKKNPHLNIGDIILITPTKLKKKYHLQIIKSEKETV